jgi:hypothetical protein
MRSSVGILFFKKSILYCTNMKHIWTNKKFLYSTISILALVAYSFVVYAAAPSGGYTPAATLDPACAPGTTDCVVTLPVAVSSFNTRTGAVVPASGDYTTDQVTEGSNLYFTNARARGALSVTGPLTYSSSTGIFAINQATTGANGYLSSVDWNTFNGKENVLTFSNGLTRVSNTVTLGGTLTADTTLANAGFNTFLTGTGGYGIGTTTIASGDKLTLAGNMSNLLTADNPPTVAATFTDGTNLLAPISVAIQQNLMYVVKYGASNNIVVYDISNRTSPVFISSFTIPGSVLPSYGVVSGRYMYVPDLNNTNLYVLDVSNPSSISLIKTVTVAVSPRFLVKRGSYLYVTSFDGNALSIVDASVPTNAHVVGTVNLGGTSRPRNVEVLGNYAYVADYALAKVYVVDISNPASPSLTSTISAGNSTHHISIRGRYMYVANQGSSSAATGSIRVYKLDNASTPVQINSVTITSPNNGPYSMRIAGQYLYVSSNYTDKLMVYSLADPTTPTVVSTLTVGNTPAYSDIIGRYLYVPIFGTAGVGNQIAIVDVKGIDTNGLFAGSLFAGSATVQDDLRVGGYMDINKGLSVGPQGLSVDGAVVTNGLLSIANSFTQDVSTSGSALYVIRDHAAAPLVSIEQSAGTIGTPTALLSGTTIGKLGFGGYNGTAYVIAKAYLAGLTTEAWGSSANGTALTFFTTANTTTTPAEVMRISGAGIVTIANLGTGTVQSTSGVLSVISDERMKNISGNFTKGLEALKGVVPITYTWNEASNLPMDVPMTGFSAQNIQANIPEAVTENKDGYLGLQDRAILATTVNAINQLDLKLLNIQAVADSADKLFLDNIRTWFADATNAITDLFVGTLHAKNQICIDDVCVTKADFQAMIQARANSGTSSNSTPSVPIPPTTPVVPVIPVSPLPPTTPSDLVVPAPTLPDSTTSTTPTPDPVPPT